jgi:hypothetical protein
MKRITINFPLVAAIGVTTALTFGLWSCSKKSGGGSSGPTPLGGYVSSDSVAPGNLIAYFPFDADANDHKGGLTATQVGSGVTFTTGIRGNAYTGAYGSYYTLSVPSGGGAYTDIGSYSESLWFKIAQEDTVTQGLFFLSGANTQDEFITEIEPYQPVSGDSVKIHTGFNDLNGPAYQLFVPETFDTNAVAKWTFMVITYDGSSGTYTVYENGVPQGTNTAFSPAPPAGAPYPDPVAYVTPNILYTDGTKATILGPIGFTSDPPKTIIIGSWPDQLFGQAAAKTCFVGQMDELRIFNKALSQTEVAGLYLNGQAGR